MQETISPSVTPNGQTSTPHEIPPNLVIILGATGDLSQRKLLPALHHLLHERGLAGRTYVLGAALNDWQPEQFQQFVREALKTLGDITAEELDAWCAKCIFYQPLSGSATAMASLREKIESIEARFNLPGNRVFYLALPPAAFTSTIEALGQEGLNQSPGWTRIVVEKPFGSNLATAKELNKLVHRHFDESQIYRIDHYLGKETVQNLLAFRFANALFENAWHRDAIERVEITVAEQLGVGTRALYYDRAGAIRDMIQNHLTQVLTLVAMDAPSAFDADSIRQEKIKVLRAVEPIDPDDLILGQYDSGRIAGEVVPGYLQEKDIPRDSKSPTFAALRLHIASWRWEGVPFYLRTGKRMRQRCSQVTIFFRRAPLPIFRPYVPRTKPNVLTITIQPDEGFDLHFEVKTPGEPFHLETEKLDFRYKDVFGPVPDAYETLLYDVMQGDQTLFVHADEVEASWRLYTPLLENPPDPLPYPAGSWGPTAAADWLHSPSLCG